VRLTDGFLVVKCHVWALPQRLQDPRVDGHGSELHPSFAKADEHSPLRHLSSHLSLRCDQYSLSSISGLTAISHTTEIRCGDNLNVGGDNLNVEMRQTLFRHLNSS
jgi:hypothetical protein